MKKIAAAVTVLFFLFIFVTTGCEPDEPYPPENFYHNFGSLTDIDGNDYRTIPIGSQVWMADNLKTTRYTDGSPITLAADNAQWADNTSGAYSWYNNDRNTNADLYGAMYNWYAVNNSSGLCPSGWQVPNESQWETLTQYLDGMSVAGGKMKETGEIPDGLWTAPNTGATNQSGFSGIPGGYRSINGSYNSIGSEGYWWTATDLYQSYAKARTLRNVHEWLVGFNANSKSGFSVRCIQVQ